MAEEILDPESRTEEPTPRRREEARRQGLVPFSAELVGSIVLLGGLAGLIYLGSAVGTGLLEICRSQLRMVADYTDGDLSAFHALLVRMFIQVLGILLPLLGLLLVLGLVASVAQVGFQINTDKLTFDFDKLNPAKGVQRLFSFAAVVRGLLTVLKVAALAVVAWWILSGEWGRISSLWQWPLAWSVAVVWRLMLRLAIILAAAVVLVAVLDYLYQRRRFELSLRMTREEVKRELREEEGDPQIKARIRQIQRERARRRMLAEVPKATVVITNPLHLAVALRYDAQRDAAPVVLARGRGRLADTIRDIARRHGVPIIAQPPLARALFLAVREGQMIPPTLYRAVAELLAFLYRLRGIPAQQSG
ncbi:MAG: flagellar biosynthesis protein FlhB [Gemmataceae bacterium]|nr:flagellar biosynthesis protein FlhB [Gemmataceae bacterium]MDW8241977.1 flagellar biosynthesis protein FlhB [Thermogemmata sp.]